MKLPLLLTTLILSASPVVADDFLYMICKNDTNVKVTDLASGKIIDDKDGEEFLLFKVDLTNKMLRNHVDPGWVDVTVEGDQIIQDTKVRSGNITTQTYASFPLILPGPISIDNQWRKPTELRVAEARGECREIDSFTWDEGVERFGKK